MHPKHTLTARLSKPNPLIPFSCLRTILDQKSFKSLCFHLQSTRKGLYCREMEISVCLSWPWSCHCRQIISCFYLFFINLFINQSFPICSRVSVLWWGSPSENSFSKRLFQFVFSLIVWAIQFSIQLCLRFQSASFAFLLSLVALFLANHVDNHWMCVCTVSWLVPSIKSGVTYCGDLWAFGIFSSFFALPI